MRLYCGAGLEEKKCRGGLCRNAHGAARRKHTHTHKHMSTTSGAACHSAQTPEKMFVCVCALLLAHSAGWCLSHARVEVETGCGNRFRPLRMVSLCRVFVRVCVFVCRGVAAVFGLEKHILRFAYVQNACACTGKMVQWASSPSQQ